MADLRDWNRRKHGGVLISGERYLLDGFEAPERVEGRGFLTDEEGPGSFRVVIIAEALWRSRFGADPNIIRKPIGMGGGTRTGVGVMPVGSVAWTPYRA